MTTFSDRVRQTVQNIPRGETRTYKEIAIAVGNPRAARAVARVLANNFDTTVPCHRVIRTDGTLAGYNRGGSHVKAAILAAEQKN